MDNPIIVWLAVAVVALTGTFLGGRFLLRRLVRWWTLLWLPKSERAVFEQKLELLESPAIVEFIAPAVDFQRDYEEGEKRRRPTTLLSPWPKAVLASWKRMKTSSRFTDARAQVKHAAALIRVEVLPDELQPENAGSAHFAVVTPLGNMTEQQVKALAPQIKGKLGLESIQADLTTDNLSVVFYCHLEEPLDRLSGKTIGVRWLDAHQSESPLLLPLALREDGESWSLPIHHTLIYGLTGAGKGSVLHGIVRQLAPFVRKGEVRLWGVDPKYEDLDKYRLSSLFLQVVSDQSEGEALVNRFYGEMKARQQARQTAREAGEPLPTIGSKAAPFELLLVDEFSSFLLEAQSKRGATLMPKFTAILAQGRSLGFYVIAAAQNIDKELLQRTRTNFVNAIALRAENDYWSDFVLGTGAAAAGFDASKILPATQANNYATAGLGYVKESAGQPIKVRFAFSSDSDIERLIATFPVSPEQKRERDSELNGVLTAQRAADAEVAAHAAPSVGADLAAAAERAAVTPPVQHPSVSSAADLQTMPLPKLVMLRDRLSMRLEQQESPKGRAMLQLVETEIRIRERLNTFPRFEPDTGEIQLPDLTF